MHTMLKETSEEELLDVTKDPFFLLKCLLCGLARWMMLHGCMCCGFVFFIFPD